MLLPTWVVLWFCKLFLLPWHSTPPASRHTFCCVSSIASEVLLWVHHKPGPGYKQKKRFYFTCIAVLLVIQINTVVWTRAWKWFGLQTIQQYRWATSHREGLGLNGKGWRGRNAVNFRQLLPEQLFTTSFEAQYLTVTMWIPETYAGTLKNEYKLFSWKFLNWAGGQMMLASRKFWTILVFQVWRSESGIWSSVDEGNLSCYFSSARSVWLYPGYPL